METFGYAASLIINDGPTSEVCDLVRRRPEVVVQRHKGEVQHNVLTRKEDVSKYGRMTGGMNLLHLALFFNRPTDEVMLILSKLPDNHLNDEWGSANTALHLAAGKGTAAVVKELLARGAHRDHLSDANNTPLDIAASDEIRALLTAEPTATIAATPSQSSAMQSLGAAYLDVLMGSDVFGRDSLAPRVRTLLKEEHGVDASSAPSTPTRSAAAHASTAASVEVERVYVPVQAASLRENDPFIAGASQIATPTRMLSTPKSVPSVRASPRKPRDSVDVLSARLTSEISSHGSPTKQTKKTNSIIVRVDAAHQNISGVSSGAMMRFAVSMGDVRQLSGRFALSSKPMNINYECSFPVAPKERQTVVVQLLQLKEKASLFRRKDDPEIEEVLLAETVLTWSMITSARNQTMEHNATWLAKDKRHLVTGYVKLVNYLHDDPNAPFVPRSFEDVRTLANEKRKLQEVLRQTFGAGCVYVRSADGLRWIERYVELKDGKIFVLTIDEPREERDVLDLFNFVNVTFPSSEELGVSNAFKVATETDHWYMYADTPQERQRLVGCIIEMAKAFQTTALPAVMNASPVRSNTTTSIASLASVRTLRA